MLFCVTCVIVFYCTILHCPVLHCSTLPPGIKSFVVNDNSNNNNNNNNNKAFSLQAWSGPEVSRKLRLPDFMTSAQDGGKVVSLTHRPPLPPGNTPGTPFC
jgi:hypothetical protein